MNNLGERLKFVRKQRGYTQESLGDTIGVSRGVIYNLEKNMTEPQEIVANALSHTLHIRKEWLLTGSGEMEDGSDASRNARLLSELYEVARELSEDEQLYLLDIIKAMKIRLRGE